MDNKSLKDQFIYKFKTSFNFRFITAAVIAIIIGLLILLIPLAVFPIEAGLIVFAVWMAYILIKALKTRQSRVSRWYVFEICFWIIVSIVGFIGYLIPNLPK